MAWLDQIRESVTIPEILSAYGVEQYGQRAKCPIHISDKQFSFSFTDTVYFCHNCGSKGSVLDLVAALENCDIYEAAAKIATKYKIGQSQLGETRKLLGRIEKYKNITEQEFEEVNKELELVYIGECRGLSQETIDHFQIMGLKSGGFYIPTRDLDGRIVSYTIRNPDGIQPKYENAKGVSGRSIVYGLYENQEAIRAKNEAIVCEGQMDCCSLWSKGFKNSVAICGSSMTVQQALTLMQYTGNLILVLDGDLAGRKGAKEIARKYKSMFNVKIVDLPEGKDPSDCSKEELKELIVCGNPPG